MTSLTITFYIVLNLFNKRLLIKMCEYYLLLNNVMFKCNNFYYIQTHYLLTILKVLK